MRGRSTAPPQGKIRAVHSDSIPATPHGVVLSEERSDESKDPYRCPEAAQLRGASTRVRWPRRTLAQHDTSV